MNVIKSTLFSFVTLSFFTLALAWIPIRYRPSPLSLRRLSCPRSSPPHLTIRRSHLFNDAKDRFMRWSANKFWSNQLRIRYVGENGIDHGGLTRDFVDQIAEYIFDPNHYLFETKEDGTMYPISDSTQPSTCWTAFKKKICSFFMKDDSFEFVGRFFGFVIAQNQSLGYELNPMLYRYIFDQEPFTMDHLKIFDAQVYTGLTNLLDMDLTANELTFSGFNGDPLCDNISPHERVTDANKKLFSELYADWYIRKRHLRPLRKIREGFLYVMSRSRTRYTMNEIKARLEGPLKIPVDELINLIRIQMGSRNSDSDDNYFGSWWLNNIFGRRRSSSFRDPNDYKHWLFNIIREWNQDPNQKYIKLFLKFVTGKRHLDTENFPEIIVEVADANGIALPIASTCSGTMKTPFYSCQSEMKEKLEKAIENCNTFELL